MLSLAVLDKTGLEQPVQVTPYAAAGQPLGHNPIVSLYFAEFTK
jgi:hypothetical protein